MSQLAFSRLVRVNSLVGEAFFQYFQFRAAVSKLLLNVAHFVVHRFEALATLRLLLALLLLADLPGQDFFFFVIGLASPQLPFLEPGRVLVEAAFETVYDAVVDDQQLIADASEQVAVMRDYDQRARVFDERDAQGLAHFEIQMIRRFIEQ